MGLVNLGNYVPSLRETGRRANLIALTCNELFRNLDEGKRLIHETDVIQALQSDAVQRSLFGREGITIKEDLDRLNRIVVYAGIILEHFSFDDLTTFLEPFNVTYEPQQFRESLMSLEFAFVLKKEDNPWSFCVSLMVDMIRHTNPEVIETQLSSKTFRKNWARLLQKIYEVDPFAGAGYPILNSD